MTHAGAAYTTDPARYWERQRPVGALGGELNLWTFEPHVGPDDVVVDFGCGGGYLLARLEGRVKVGIDPSPLARDEAERQGVQAVAGIGEIAAGFADVVVSNHALEHTLSPIDELRGLRRVLRPGGRLVIAVPVDDWRSQRHPDPADPDRHLYTWTPKLLANLLAEGGFQVESVTVNSRAWHPRVTPRIPVLLRPAFGRLLALVLRRRELIAVAHKAEEAVELPGTRSSVHRS